jgi:hypothetical protein
MWRRCWGDEVGGGNCGARRGHRPHARGEEHCSHDEEQGQRRAQTVSMDEVPADSTARLAPQGYGANDCVTACSHHEPAVLRVPGCGHTPCATAPYPPARPPSRMPAPASPERIRWAVLPARIYDVLPLLRPACDVEMRILAFLTGPPVVPAILLHLGLPQLGRVALSVSRPRQGSYRARSRKQMFPSASARCRLWRGICSFRGVC